MPYACINAVLKGQNSGNIIRENICLFVAFAVVSERGQK